LEGISRIRGRPKGLGRFQIALRPEDVAEVVKPEEAWDLVHYLRTLQVNNLSLELTMSESTAEGKAIVTAKRMRNPYTGSGVTP
jgi:hypothetical protein